MFPKPAYHINVHLCQHNNYSHLRRFIFHGLADFCRMGINVRGSLIENATVLYLARNIPAYSFTVTLIIGTSYYYRHMHTINTVRTGAVMCTILILVTINYSQWIFVYLSSPLKMQSENA